MAKNPKKICTSMQPLEFSAALMEEAKRCVEEHYYNFYDGCLEVCITDRMILPLSHYQDLEELVYGKIFPAIVLLAILSNLAVAIVLSKKHMITPTNVVLKYMAIAELLVGLIPLPWTTFFFTFKYHKNTEDLHLWWCYLNKYSMDALPPIFHNIAMWLTVLLAAQRFVSISYPLHSRSICNVRNVRLVTIMIAIISILCGMPKSFDYFLDTVDGWVFTPQREWRYMKACTTSPTPLLRAVGQTVFYNIYFWTRTVAFIILPSVLLVILNILLIRQIRRAEKRKRKLLKEKRSEEAARQRDSNSTSYMLVFVVTLFLIVNLPQAAFMAVLCVCETFNIRLSLLEGIFPAVFLLSSNMFVMATYPVNFGIYCFMSSSFRETFKALFCPTWLTQIRQALKRKRTSNRSNNTAILNTTHEATDHLMLSECPSAKYFPEPSTCN